MRDFALITFGGSGSLLLCRLIDIVGVPVGVVPRDPGNLSAFGLLTVDVKVDHVQTYVARATPSSTCRRSPRIWPRCRQRASAALAGEGFAPAERRFAASADLRYFGQAFEVRVPLADGPFSRGRRPTRRWPRSTTRTSSSTGTASGTGRSSRSSGSTCG